MKENFRMLRPYLRGLPLIIFSMVIGVFLAKTYLNYTVPMYESTAKLKLAELDEGVPANNLFKEFEVFGSANKIAAEIEVVKSQLLINKVVENLDFNIEIYRVGKIKTVELYENSPIIVKCFNISEKSFDQLIDVQVLNKENYELTLPNSKRKIRGSLGDIVNTEMGTFFISLNENLLAENPNLHVVDHYKFEIFSPEKLYRNISKNLNITPVDKDVPILRITYKNANPKKASLFVNELAKVYISDYIETKYKAAHLTVEFLDGQINNTFKKIAGSENKIQNYRDDRRITNILQETETDLKKVSELKMQQTKLKMTLEGIREVDRYVRNGKNFMDLAPNFEEFTDALSSEIIKKIKEFQAQKRELLLIYTPKDEHITVIDEKIHDLSSYLTESIKNSRQNLEIKNKNLSNDIRDAEKVFKTVPEKERILNDLNREFNIYQQTYNFLNERKIEAEIAAAAKMAFHKIIAPGEVPLDPVSPNKTVIVIISAILGMFGSILFIYIVHKVKAKVNDVQTIEAISTIPVSMLTPKYTSDEDIAKHFLKEALQLEIKGLVKEKAIICMTAYRNSEGVDFNAFCLAKAFATQGRRVLLVDVANQLKYFKKLSTDELLIVENIELRTLSNPAFDSYTKGKMVDLFEEYRKDMDVIIILNESFEDESKAKLLMSISDVNFMVVDTRLTPKKRILEAEVLNDEYKFPCMNFLLNRYDYTPNLLKEFYIFRRK